MQAESKERQALGTLAQAHKSNQNHPSYFFSNPKAYNVTSESVGRWLSDYPTPPAAGPSWRSASCYKLGEEWGARSLREGEEASLSSWATPSPLPPNSGKEWGGPNASEGTAA